MRIYNNVHTYCVIVYLCVVYGRVAAEETSNLKVYFKTAWFYS